MSALKRVLGYTFSFILIISLLIGCGNSASKVVTTEQNEVSTGTQSSSNASSSDSTITGDKQQNDNKAKKTEQSDTTKEVAKHSAGNTFSNLLNGGKVVEANDSDYIYYNVQGKLYRAKKDGTEETVLVEKSYSNLNYMDGYLYTGELAMGKIDIKNPSIAETILKGSDLHIQSIFATKEWIYYKNNGSIFRVKPDGSGNERIKLNAIANGNTALFVAGDYLYLTTDSYKTYRVNVNDTSKFDIFDFQAFDITEKNIFSSKSNDGITISNIDGTGSKMIYELEDKQNCLVSRINVSHDWVYFTVNDMKEAVTKSILYKMKTDGSSKQKVFETYDLQNLQIAGDCIFFKSYTSNKINNTYTLQKIKTDGSGKVEYGQVP